MTNLPMPAITAWLDETAFTNLGTVAFVLMIICSLLGIVYFARGLSASGSGDEANEAAAEPVPAAEPLSMAEPTAPAADDGALIAVLTAAVAAVLEAEAEAAGTPAPSFRVVSFQRSSRGRSWNA